MTTSVQLNNIDHRQLRVDVRSRGAAFGDGVMFTLTFPGEFRSVQAHYPIVFHKSTGGEFQPVALFGFKPGQNLFLRGTSWDASYLPLAIERQPFLIGRAGEALEVHLDLDNPRVVRDGGEPLFRDHGGSTELLDRVSSMLGTLHQGMQSTPGFVEALLRHELLESFMLDIELDDGSQNRFTGFYTIAEDRLRGLAGAVLEALQRAGHLEPIFMAVASLSNFRDLIERMNRLDVADR